MRFENGQIIIDLTGSLVSTLIFAGWMLFGWARGFRYIVTIAGGLTLGYLLTVQGGGVVVNFVNAFYGFFLRFLGFISAGLVDVLPPSPIIPATQQAPLLLRVLVFTLLFAVGISYTGPWEGGGLRGFAGNRQLRLLGAFAGFYSALLLVNALAIFWAEGRQFVEFPEPLMIALNSLNPNIEIVSVFLVAFLGLLGFIFLTRFN
ncbi:MAG TPA: hypothetical protein PKA05_00210, partial [Roseiflexaceae bacterium]|nr:hypothetical protein [Roseiflexaceae bacterium]